MKPKLALFLELGGTLEEWNHVGFFSREIALYNKLAREYFDTIYIFTYGGSKDLTYTSSLERNIVVIPRGQRSRSYINNFLYELWLPFRHYSTLNKCHIFKTNQNSGSIAATIAKLLLPKSKLVIRSGYIGSELDREKLSFTTKAYYLLAENLSYRACDRVLIPQRDATILSQKYPAANCKITVLNNTINTTLFCKTEDTKMYDIIYVARLNDTKNHLSLLEAIKGTGLRILFIGIGDNREKISKIAQAYSVNVRIIDAVPNEQLPQYYNTARICAFPSLQEGNPKALLEAMSCELPVVALDSPGVSNIVLHEKNGLIGGTDGMRGHIMRLLNDRTLRDTLGKAARETVLDGYSFDVISNQEIGIYKNLLTTYE